MLLGVPEVAKAQTVTLVSNTGQSADADAAGTLDRAQAFTTGSNSGGYTLSSIDIISEDPQGDDASVSVCTVDGSGYPTTTCTALTAPSSFAAGTLTFTASPVMTLTSTTTYTVLIGIPGGGTLILDSTTSDNEDLGAAAGWSLADSYDFKTSSNVWETISNGQSFRITIKGTVGTTTTTQAVWSATFTTVDLGFNLFGCSNGVPSGRCSSTTVLSEDSFTYDSTDYTITDLFTRGSGGNLEFKVDPDFTTNTLADLTLVVGSTSLVLSGGTASSNIKLIFNSPGITLTPGTAINVKLTTGTTTTVTNTAPRVANPIADRTATVGTALNFTFPTNTFNDANDDTLTYTATKSDNSASALPSWLSFDEVTRTFSGTPATADVGTVSVTVTASDGNGGSVSDTFDIVVSADPPTERPTVPAQAAVLVSNVGQSGADGFGLDANELAQSFTTGDNATGYTLTNIELTLQTASSTATPTVKLYRGSADGTEVSTLTGPAMLDTNTIKNYAFTPSPTVTLGTSTTYWVVAEGDAFWVSTTSTSEDGTPAMGWEIGDAYESRVASSTGNFTTSAGPAFMIRVNGTTRSGGGGGNGGGGNGGGGNGGNGGGGGGGGTVTAVGTAVVAVVVVAVVAAARAAPATNTATRQPRRPSSPWTPPGPHPCRGRSTRPPTWITSALTCPTPGCWSSRRVGRPPPWARCGKMRQS